MLLTKVEVKNFKAIQETTLPLSEFNVIVGTNGSGKSSILQALHWMFQSGRNSQIEPRGSSGKGATLSEKDATYMPSPDYKNAGHAAEYGNKQGTPQLDLKITAKKEDKTELKAEMWIKSARNEGISVHVPSNNEFVTALRNRDREFSAYIPGLAGIPLLEEKRSKMISQRLAAAGDANTVLRNILDLLKQQRSELDSGLTILQEYVSEVMDEITLRVTFEEDKHQYIIADFQTREMKDADAKRFKALELAGIGFLQVIQIFAYLVYFRPVLLLVDEPDSHLHPTAQERLIPILSRAAKRFGTQVILTTHSPSIVRALPAEARVIWMKKGKVQPNGDTSGRRLMGWGLLDKKLLLMTEDTETEMLRVLLSQWPDLERSVAIWPFHGSSNLPEPKTVSGLKSLTDASLTIVLHRDRDFMMPAEIEALQKPYEESGHHMWFTRSSDMEAYWADSQVIAKHFDIDVAAADVLLTAATKTKEENDKALGVRRKKRIDAINKINAAKKGELPQFNDEEVRNEAAKHGNQHVVLGKDLVKAIRGKAQNANYDNYHSFGETLPEGLSNVLAPDLEEILRQALNS